MAVRMSMAGLGRAWELWRLPVHSFINLRDTYLGILTAPKDDEDDEVTKTTLAPGVQLEERKRPE